MRLWAVPGQYRRIAVANNSSKHTCVGHNASITRNVNNVIVRSLFLFLKRLVIPFSMETLVA